MINQYIYTKTNNERLLTDRCPLSIVKEAILHDPIKSCCAKVAWNLIPNSDLPSLSRTLSGVSGNDIWEFGNGNGNG